MPPNPCPLPADPWSEPDPLPPAEPHRALHVLDQDASLSLDEGLLLIARDGQAPLRLRLGDLESVSIHGRAGITTPCLHALMQEGIPLLWRGVNGWYHGQAVGPSPSHAATRRAQYRMQEQPGGLAIARRLVGAKIVAVRALLRRRGTADPGLREADRAVTMCRSARCGTGSRTESSPTRPRLPICV